MKKKSKPLPSKKGSVTKKAAPVAATKKKTSSKKDLSEIVSVWTCPGRVSFPHFAEPDTTSNYPDNAYKGQLIVTKAEWEVHPRAKALRQAILKVGREAHGENFSLKSKKSQIPLVDLDLEDETSEEMKGCVKIVAKAGPKRDGSRPAKQPIFIKAKKDPDTEKFPKLSQDEIEEIKGGDYVAYKVNVYAFEGNKKILPGVSLYLSAVQFWKEGEAFGGGGVDTSDADELPEDEADEPEDDDEDVEEEGSEETDEDEEEEQEESSDDDDEDF